MSVFEKYRSKSYEFRYKGTLSIGTLVGGTPTDPKVAEAWLKKKLGVDDESQLQAMVAQTMVERGVTMEEAVQAVNAQKNLNGFKRDDTGLFIEGRQLKSALKEAVNVAIAVDKLPKRGWGTTNKGLQGFFPEHVFVLEDRLHLKVDGEPVPHGSDLIGVNQRFVHTWRGTGIQYEEYVNGCTVDFTIEADTKFGDETWATIWLTGEKQGIGASRSQGYGVYEITRWDLQK